ncbi:hypothetical protein HDU76_005817 [Blyttiomyces sp. JEL0837]|nr:hypothetical protein HDU76_005817 [Blyttiomyces sp. JEL0837]
MRDNLGPLVLAALALTTSVVMATVPDTLPIVIPKNEYFVASNLITSIEYLHRAFPEHPSIYTQNGNFVYKYIDPVSGNLTDFVDVGDLYQNAKSFNDVLVGIETVMFNQLPNPDTDPLPIDSVANLKLAVNYITNIASYDFSTSDQSYIASFYNFTIGRYSNLFSRENTTSLIPLKPLNLTNNPSVIAVPTPLKYNISIFDAIDGPTFNNTLSQNGTQLQIKVLNIIADTMKALGIPVTLLNGTNPTTTTASSSITPTPAPTSVYTTPEPSVTDPNDPGGFRRRRRGHNHHHNQNQHLHARMDPLAAGFSGFLVSTGAGSSSGPTTVNGVLDTIGFMDSAGKVVVSGLRTAGSAASTAASSLRSTVALGTADSIKTVAELTKGAQTSLNSGIQAGIKAGFAEGAKGSGVGTSAKAGALALAGAVSSDLVGALGTFAAPIIDQASGATEQLAMETALTSFFGVSAADAKEAASVTQDTESLKGATTFAKTLHAIGYLTSKNPGLHPDLEHNSPEEIVGARIDSILADKYSSHTPPLTRNSQFKGVGKQKDFPAAEFNALRDVLEGQTDRVATNVEFDEAKFMSDLAPAGQAHPAEETFGYHITAAKGIDEAVTAIGTLTTDNAVTTGTNADFVESKVTAMGGSDALVSKLKATPNGKAALQKLGKNLLRARTRDNANEDLKMDADAARIYNAIGDKGFGSGGVTDNVRSNLKSTAARAASAKKFINNKTRQISRNLSAIKR